MGLDPQYYKIKGQWRDRLEQISEINLTEHVDAEFKVGNRSITARVESAFDPVMGSLWITDRDFQVEDLFYQAISDRIFENPKRFLAVVLKEAVRSDLREQESFPSLQDVELEDVTGGEDSENDSDLGQSEEPGETKLTHPARPPNPRRNVPNPGPIPVEIPGSGNLRKNPRRSGRTRSRIEDDQSDDLKDNHYAWHCQVCLAKYEIPVLAPDQSYVQMQENRRGIIRVHHPDQVHSGGQRHAGNLLILCIYHHDLLGDAISKQMIATAIEKTSTTLEVVFSTSQIDGISKRIQGKLVSVPVPTRETEIDFFFTNDHAEYWIEKANE